MASRKKNRVSCFMTPSLHRHLHLNKQTNTQENRWRIFAYHDEIDESHAGSSHPRLSYFFPKPQPSRNWWKYRLIALAIKLVFTRGTVNKITQFSSLYVCADNRQLKVTAVDWDGHNGELSSPVCRLNFISQSRFRNRSRSNESVT